jgi:hypothetical protein
MHKGSVYILKNPVLPEDMLKIGRTEHGAQKRAKQLFTTGLPEEFNICYERDVPDCIVTEKLVHQKLKKYRHKANREFFVIPLQEAISTVEEVIHEEFDESSKPIQAGIHRLSADTTFRWSCYAKGFILLFRHESWLSEKPKLINFWGCKAKDHMLLTSRPEDDPSSLVELAKKSYVPGSLSEIIIIYPGDRIVVIGSPKSESDSQQLSLFEPELSIISIIDCWKYGKMMGFMEKIEIHPDGFPIPFGDCFEDKAPAIVYEAFDRVIKMGTPDVYPNPDYINRLT